MERIKLIWDFRGPNAKHIATHHAKHLSEFVRDEAIKNAICETEAITEMHHIAFLITDKNQMEFLRERLKPNRGRLYTK